VSGTVFWDVDTQVDFMRPDGRLYVPGAADITAALQALSRYARGHGIVRVASVCDHVAGDDELSDAPDFVNTFPPHCLRGTPGQAKIPETAMASPVVVPNRPEDRALLASRLGRHTGEILIEKNHFDVFTNPNALALLDVLSPRTVVVYGVAQDVCDAQAIAGLLRRGGVRVLFVEDAARSIDAARGAALLAEWTAKGVGVVKTADVLRGVAR
jgi:nicotinamidase/pyrazinamidase